MPAGGRRTVRQLDRGEATARHLIAVYTGCVWLRVAAQAWRGPGWMGESSTSRVVMLGGGGVPGERHVPLCMGYMPGKRAFALLGPWMRAAYSWR